MLQVRRWRFLFVLALGTGMLVAAEEKKGDGRLKLVESVPRDELNTVVRTAISQDGKFLYAASWRIAALNVYARDPKTGRLENKQTITDVNNLAGATDVRLSPDGRMVLAIAFASKAALLYSRDPQTGKLSLLDVARDGEKAVRLRWPIQGAFSPDSKLVSVLDDVGEGDRAPGALVNFRVNGGKLELAGIDEGKDACYSGARGLAVHPSGKTLFIAAYRASALVVAERDPKSGNTSVRQVVKDDEGAAHGLAGAFGVALSPDGRHVYVCAGRFGGDDAVSAFQLAADGRLAVIQEFVDGRGELQGFLGGNELAVSPDGLNVYAVATRSGSIASFRRDPESGKLTYLGTIPDCAEGGPNGAAGVTVSPDNQFVYVATEDKSTISIFNRDTGK